MPNKFMPSPIPAKALGGTRMRTGVIRVSFPHLFEPRINEDGTQGSYGLSLIFSKEDKAMLSVLLEKMKQAYQEGVEGGVLKASKSFKSIKKTLKDGAESYEDDEYYHDKMVLNCSSNKAPSCIKRAPAGSPQKFVQITDPEEMYAGCYAIASINIKAHKYQGGGITAYVDNLLFYADGERFAGAPSAEQDFDELADLIEAPEDDLSGLELYEAPEEGAEVEDDPLADLI